MLNVKHVCRLRDGGQAIEFHSWVVVSHLSGFILSFLCISTSRSVARGYRCLNASYVILNIIFAAVWYKRECDPLQHLTRNKTHVDQGFHKSTLPYFFQWRPLLFRESNASFAVETRVNYWYKIKTCGVLNQIYHCVVKSDYYSNALE